MQPITTSPPNDLLTDEQVAELSGVKPKTLANWRCKGVGPKFVKVGATIRYRPEDLQAFIASRVFQSTTEYAVHRAGQRGQRPGARDRS